MRRPLILLGLLLVGTIGWACGDKLMLVMGARYGQLKPVHPAAILAFPGNSASATLIRGLQSQSVLKKAGMRFQVVEDNAGLDNALKTGKYDLVITDVTDASGLTREVSTAASKPLLLPVAFKATKLEQSEAQKKYHCLMKAPGSAENYLDAIDHAMEWKLKGATR